VSILHFHKWKYSEVKHKWYCVSCGEYFKDAEILREYSDIDDPADTPQGYLNRLSSWRKGPAEYHDFRK